MKIFGYKHALYTSAALLAFLALSPNPGMSAEADRLDEFQRIIEQQQRMIEAQAKTLESLNKQIEDIRAATRSNAEAVAKSEQAVKQVVRKAEAAATPPKTVTSGSDKVRLVISGQINRGVMVVGDGDSSQIHHVDNDTSSTRFRFVGTGKPNEDITIGTRMEMQLEVNSSANVVQGADTQTGGTTFSTRYADLSVESKKLGKLYLGQGDTASNTMAEQDLSGTDLIVYSDFGMYGSLLFKNSAGGASSGVSVANALSNFDGESRKSRIRYDTPRFAGFQGRIGHMAGDKSDFAVHFSGAFGDTKLAAMVGYVSDGSASATVDSKYGGSASVLFGNGISLTGLYTGQDFRASGRGDANTLSGSVAYGKIGYRAKLLDIGETRFAVEAGETEDLAQDGDEAFIWGAGLVQGIDDWGAEGFLGFRVHDLDRAGLSTDDLIVGMTGLRVKF